MTNHEILVSVIGLVVITIVGLAAAFLFTVSFVFCIVILQRIRSTILRIKKAFFRRVFLRPLRAVERAKVNFNYAIDLKFFVDQIINNSSIGIVVAFVLFTIRDMLQNSDYLAAISSIIFVMFCIVVLYLNMIRLVGALLQLSFPNYRKGRKVGFLEFFIGVLVLCGIIMGAMNLVNYQIVKTSEDKTTLREILIKLKSIENKI